jgi:hypothetical protein
MGAANYSARDQQGKVAFYVLLWKRKGISLELFDDYWRNVHGPVCARLPGQFQYWQLHVAHNDGGIWPEVQGISYKTTEADNFDGIAELTFRSDQDRTTWFRAAGILMDDEHNLFSKAIGYNSNPGNSITYVDRIPDGEPNGSLGVPKFHVMVKKSDGASVDKFRSYLKDTFATKAAASELVLKLRLHLFEEVDASRPQVLRTANRQSKAIRLLLKLLSTIVWIWRAFSQARPIAPQFRIRVSLSNNSVLSLNVPPTRLCMTAR